MWKSGTQRGAGQLLFFPGEFSFVFFLRRVIVLLLFEFDGCFVRLLRIGKKNGNAPWIVGFTHARCL